MSVAGSEFPDLIACILEADIKLQTGSVVGHLLCRLKIDIAKDGSAVRRMYPLLNRPGVALNVSVVTF